MPQVLDRFRNLFRKQADVPIINDGRGNLPSITVRYVSPLGAPSWSSRDYAGFATQGYSKNSDVYACISLIATAGKQVKWDTEPGSPSIESVKLLAKAGGPTFIEHWLSFLLISGNAFVEIGRNAQGQPVALYLIPPDRVHAKTNVTTEGEDARYPKVTMWHVRNARGYPYPVAPADMMHSKLFNPLDPIYGMSPIEAALLDIDAQNESATLMKRLMQAGFSPGWIEASPESDWTDTQVAQLRERVKRTREQGEALFLQNAKWNDMGGFKPNDTGVSQQQTLTKRDIASVFHVDPALIGDTSTRTYATYHESRQALYMEAVIPLLEHFKGDWNRAIAVPSVGIIERPGYNESPLEFDKNSFDALVATRAEAAERVVKLWTSGLIMQNEAREALAYEAVPGGDVFYAPANFLPLQGSEAEPL
jgi:HK97 family phage portal protein